MAAVPTSSTSIRLAWAPVSHASGYGIERSTDAVTWRPVGSTHEGQTSYTDVALLSGTTYYYRVVALVDGGEAMRSDTVTVTTTTDSGPPVFISATSSASIVDLAWSDVDGETGYRLERSPDGTTGWETIGTTGQGETSFSDRGTRLLDGLLLPSLRNQGRRRVATVDGDLGDHGYRSALDIAERRPHSRLTPPVKRQERRLHSPRWRV